MAIPLQCALDAAPPSYAEELSAILNERRLNPVFQPIVDLNTGAILGCEGLIRGPSNSALHAPTMLFAQAARHGLTARLDLVCRRIITERFVELKLPGLLFLNVNPESLLSPEHSPDKTRSNLRQIGLDCRRVIIELTETQPNASYQDLQQVTARYRQQGYRIALDDLGEGFSNLRLWSELRPDFVKLDKHFVQNIQHDPLKEQFVRSMVDIAQQSGAFLVAEGIESAAELRVLRHLGVQYGQGYLIARPCAVPALDMKASIDGVVWTGARGRARQQPVAADLLIEIRALELSDNNDTAYRLFADNPDCFAIPVLENSVPVGLLRREHFLERFARPFNRELYAKKSCCVMMDPEPLVVPASMTIQELSGRVVASGRKYLSDGFIITEQGFYRGMGTGFDLMRKITELQISAARYANPLTGLPGNVPINETIDRLLLSSLPFVVAYADLDNFKPFNDMYGYAAGDELIELLAGLLLEQADGERDFVGHVGGDDFVLLMQSGDWEARLRGTLQAFDRQVAAYFEPAHQAARGFHVRDRRGEPVFVPLTTLSIGVLGVEPGRFASYYEIASAAAETKKMAKRSSGSSLFIERRRGD
ncbi:EAL domain-containing protein [Paludibacterium yongneupense]|uniref:EAL domain-containing protein n=1 Tax=Paludibacterium yongneupense TaxID=400061 RepID=UPI0004234D9A|nr:EAL domain-containing protein [Paludibacterium yongneupense]